MESCDRERFVPIKLLVAACGFAFFHFDIHHLPFTFHPFLNVNTRRIPSRQALSHAGRTARRAPRRLAGIEPRRERGHSWSKRLGQKHAAEHPPAPLEPPSGGRVVLGHQDPAALAEPELALFRNRKIGFVFQDHHLLPQCSVLENVVDPHDRRGPNVQATADRARMLLDRVGLGERLDYRPRNFRRRATEAALARAMILAPVAVAGRRAGRQSRPCQRRQRWLPDDRASAARASDADRGHA